VEGDGARVGEEGHEDEVVQIESFHQDPRVIGQDGEVPHAGHALARPVPLQTKHKQTPTVLISVRATPAADTSHL